MKRPVRVVAWANSSGSSLWRIKDPLFLLNLTGKFECRNTTEGISREILEWGDIFITQTNVDKMGISLLYEYQQEHGKKLVVEQDDYFTVDKDNPYKLHHDITNASEVIRITMGIADLVTASTPYLAKQLKPYAKNIVVLPNYMLMDRWDLNPKLKNDSDSIRILWAGSITHIRDMTTIKDVLLRLSKEFPQTEYYFVGDIRMMSTFKDIVRSEYMLGTDFLAWPSKLQGIRADIGLVPLLDARFTRCKSWIKPLEYGINEVPCVVSDVEPYKALKDFPGVHLVKSGDDWYREIKGLILDEKRRKQEGKALCEKVRKEMNLQDHIYKWADAYMSIL